MIAGNQSDFMQWLDPNNIPTIQNINSQVIARENAMFNQCVGQGGKKAIVTGAVETYSGEDPSTTKAIANMGQETLDLQNECLGSHPLAVLDPKYGGIAMPGDIGRKPSWAALFGF